jgi:hypothetical protein
MPDKKEEKKSKSVKGGSPYIYGSYVNASDRRPLPKPTQRYSLSRTKGIKSDLEKASSKLSQQHSQGYYDKWGVYKAPLTKNQAYQELTAYKGSQFGAPPRVSSYNYNRAPRVYTDISKARPTQGRKTRKTTRNPYGVSTTSSSNEGAKCRYSSDCKGVGVRCDMNTKRCRKVGTIN